MRNLIFSFLAIVVFGCVGCQKDYVKLNDDEIKEYIFKNNIDAQRTSEGLYYVVNEEGSGDRPTVSDNVTVHYSGYLTNGSVFD